MDEITDPWFGEAVVKSQDAFVNTSSSTKRRSQTTQGVSLCIKWCYRNTTWVVLKEIKDSYSLQLAEYAVAAKIPMDIAFAWWLHHTLKNRNRIIIKVESKYWLKTHKFGINVPKTMNQEIEFDSENGNTLWWDAMCQEIKNICPAFDPWEKP